MFNPCGARSDSSSIDKSEKDDLDSKIDELTVNKISKDRNLPPYMISKQSDLYKNTFNQIKDDFIKGKIHIANHSNKETSSDDNDDHESVNDNVETVKSKLPIPNFKWINLPSEDDLSNYSKRNEICSHLVKLYKERFVEIQNKLLELRDIINDVEKYSNY